MADDPFSDFFVLADIDRTGGMPIYIQLEQTLEEQIRSGVFEPGDRLPTEREISEQTGVSRMTVRKAMERLVIRGLVTRMQGSGTFVADNTEIHQSLSELKGLTQELESYGIKLKNRLLDTEEIFADKTERQALGLNIGDRVYRILRLRSRDDNPVLIENVSLPVNIFSGFLDLDLENQSIYKLMESYNARPMKATQSILAREALPKESEYLCLPESAPVMFVERTALDENNRPVEFGRYIYRGDRIRFFAELYFNTK